MNDILSEELLPCPFCGGKPSLQRRGSCIDIDCCCSMSFQKSDYLTIPERETWSNTTYQYSEDAEEKALKKAIGCWNSRVYKQGEQP